MAVEYWIEEHNGRWWVYSNKNGRRDSAGPLVRKDVAERLMDHYVRIDATGACHEARTVGELKAILDRYPDDMAVEWEDSNEGVGQDRVMVIAYAYNGDPKVVIDGHTPGTAFLEEHGWSPD